MWEREAAVPGALALVPLLWLRKMPTFLLPSSVASKAAVVMSAVVLSAGVAGVGLFAALLFRTATSDRVVSPSVRAEVPATATVAIGDSIAAPSPMFAVMAQVVVATPTETPVPATATPTTTRWPIDKASGGAYDRPTATPTSTAAPAPSFALGVDVDGDGLNDCGTGVPVAVGDGLPDAVAMEISNTDCVAAADATLAVRVYLMDSGRIAYAGQSSRVYFAGFETASAGAVHWACGSFDRFSSGPGWENTGRDQGVSAGSPGPCTADQIEASAGVANEFTLTCTQGGSLSLGHAEGETALKDHSLKEHHEAGPDILSITCGDRTPAPAESPLVSITQRAALAVD